MGVCGLGGRRGSDIDRIRLDVADVACIVVVVAGAEASAE